MKTSLRYRSFAVAQHRAGMHVVGCVVVWSVPPIHRSLLAFFFDFR